MSSNDDLGLVDVRDFMGDEEFEELLKQDPLPFSPAHLKALKQDAHREKQRMQRKDQKSEDGHKLIAAEVGSLSLRDIELALSKAKNQDSRTRLRVLLVMKKIELKKKAQEDDLAARAASVGKNFKPAYVNMGGRHMRLRRNGRYARR